MSVELTFRLTSGETVGMEVPGGSTVRELKTQIALETGLREDRMQLSFEGEDLNDTRKVCEYLFEDQSEVVVGMDRREAAFVRLEEIGYNGKTGEDVHEEMQVLRREGRLSGRADVEFREVLETMQAAGVVTFNAKMMWTALRYDFRRCFEALLAMCPDGNILGPHLSFAVQNDNRVLAEQLLVRGADPTPALIAAMRTGTQIVKLLISHGANPNATLRFNSNRRRPGRRQDAPLLIAVTHDNVEMARILLDGGANPNEMCSGNTPLHTAVMNNFTTMAELLVAKGADPNMRLDMVLATLRIRNRKVLLDCGADPKIVDCAVKTASYGSYFYRSYTRDYNSVVEKLAKSAGPNILHNITHAPLDVAVNLNNVPMARCLLFGGADPNKGNHASTPLHTAVKKNFGEMVELLLSKGADPNLELNMHLSDPIPISRPIYVAVEQGHTSIACLLRAYGAKVELRRSELPAVSDPLAVLLGEPQQRKPSYQKGSRRAALAARVANAEEGREG